MDAILNKLSERINEWERVSRDAIEAETTFKAYEASITKAHMDSGASAAKAQTETRSTEGWSQRYLQTQEYAIAVEKLKKQIKLGELMFDAERTKQANQRRIV
jgi:hypothetical protein